MFGKFEPIIPRELRLEVTERVDAAGRIVTPLVEEELHDAAVAPSDGMQDPLLFTFCTPTPIPCTKRAPPKSCGRYGQTIMLRPDTNFYRSTANTNAG